MATNSSLRAWRIPWTEEPGGLTVHGVAKESDRTERLTLSLLYMYVDVHTRIHTTSIEWKKGDLRSSCLLSNQVEPLTRYVSLSN